MTRFKTPRGRSIAPGAAASNPADGGDALGSAGAVNDRGGGGAVFASAATAPAPVTSETLGRIREELRSAELVAALEANAASADLRGQLVGALGDARAALNASLDARPLDIEALVTARLRVAALEGVWDSAAAWAPEIGASDVDAAGPALQATGRIVAAFRDVKVTVPKYSRELECWRALPPGKLRDKTEPPVRLPGDSALAAAFYDVLAKAMKWAENYRSLVEQGRAFSERATRPHAPHLPAEVRDALPPPPRLDEITGWLIALSTHLDAAPVLIDAARAVSDDAATANAKRIAGGNAWTPPDIEAARLRDLGEQQPLFHPGLPIV